MPVVPNKRDDMIDFFAAHVAGWVANQASIGITIIQAADLTTFITDAQQALLAADTARNAAQAATLDLQTKATALRDYGGDLVRLIKAHAESQPDPAAVYIAFFIPQPAVDRHAVQPQPALAAVVIHEIKIADLAVRLVQGRAAIVPEVQHGYLALEVG